MRPGNINGATRDMLITVVNKGYKERTYVGRPSVLGNPYVIGRDGNRREVIRKYRVWLDRQMSRGAPAADEIMRLAHLVQAGIELELSCWCAPQPCHADVIKKVVERIIKEM